MDRALDRCGETTKSSLFQIEAIEAGHGFDVPNHNWWLGDAETLNSAMF